MRRYYLFLGDLLHILTFLKFIYEIFPTHTKCRRAFLMYNLTAALQ